MLTSIAIIFLLGLLLGSIFERMKLPSLLGYILAGIILSPYACNLIDESILSIAPQLRQIALVIILTRAGLSLDIAALTQVGRPAVLLCFFPACLEIFGAVILAPKLLGVTMLEAAIIGSVLAAVSPAVIVPRMIRLIEQGYQKNHGIPQMILAGASVDDVFVIVVFTAVTSLAAGESVMIRDFVKIPISIVLGLVFGVVCGIGLIALFRRLHMRDSVKLLIVLSVSFLLLELEKQLEGYVPVSGLLAIMGLGVTIKLKYGGLAVRLQSKYNKMWVGAELLLFVLVGATVDLQYVWNAGVTVVLVVVGALLFRMAGVYICLLKTPLTGKERLFCMIAYMPKATVQAGIGAVPLSMGLSCGNTVLTVAVLSILITAPIGAIAIDRSYHKLLD